MILRMLRLSRRALSTTRISWLDRIASGELVRSTSHRPGPKLSRSRPQLVLRGPDGEGPPPGPPEPAPLELRLRPVVQPLEPPRVFAILELRLPALVAAWALPPDP